MTAYLTTPENRRIAYQLTHATRPDAGVGIVFCGGYKSDMGGTKALALEAWAKAQGRAFLRFDYSGHGASDGKFEDGAIGDWYEDARDAIAALTDGPQIVVGSSMGGWISLLLARAFPTRFAGLVTIAAAPDFTEDHFWAHFTKEQKHQLEETGYVDLPSDYGEPYRVTRRLVNEGRNHLVLRSPLPLPFPTRFLQGTADTAVTTDTALRLLEHAEGDDLRLTLVKGADHSFSTPDALALVFAAISEIDTRTKA